MLPPVRLPEEAELAAQARRSALLAGLRALADEVRKTTVQAAAVDPALLRLAEEADLVERDGDSDPVVADDLDLEGHGPALVTRLFMSRGDGVRITELAGALKDDATAGLEAEEGGRAVAGVGRCPW